MNKNKIFIACLILPIASLIILTLLKAYSLQSGIRFILPISGYDPVNPISGHFVTYRVDYGNGICENYNLSRDRISCVCLKKEEGANHYFIPNCEKDLIKQCDAYLKGKCSHGRFEAGIEEYFIPEEKADSIDKTVRKGKSKIKISVTKDGKGMVEDLILID